MPSGGKTACCWWQALCDKGLAYQKQMQLFEEQQAGFKERDLSCYALNFFAQKPCYKDSRLQNIKFRCASAYFS